MLDEGHPLTSFTLISVLLACSHLTDDHCLGHEVHAFALKNGFLAVLRLDGSGEARRREEEAEAARARPHSRVESAGLVARCQGSTSVAHEAASAEDDRPRGTPGSCGPEARRPGSRPAKETMAAADGKHEGCNKEVLEVALHFLVLRLPATVTRKDLSDSRVVL